MKQALQEQWPISLGNKSMADEDHVYGRNAIKYPLRTLKKKIKPEKRNKETTEEIRSRYSDIRPAGLISVRSKSSKTKHKPKEKQQESALITVLQLWRIYE